MALPPKEQRHPFLKFEGLEYTNADIVDFEERLVKICDKGVHRVQVFDFGGLTTEMAEGLCGGAKRRISWREFILGMGLHTAEEMESAGFSTYWAESARQILDKGDLSAYWIGISFEGDFLGSAPSYTTIRDPMLRLCHQLIACSIAGRSQAPKKICDELDDTWAWVAPGPERQPDVVVSAPEVAEGAPDDDEGA
ncbi:hypothetical protein Tco_1115017 [Tanacetum coccineum]